MMQSLVSTPLSALRITAMLIAGLLWLGIVVAVMIPLCIILLPFRRARIVVTNIAGTLIGRPLVWLAGCPVHVEGRENADGRKSVIIVGNHTSILDAFTSIWLVPRGTVGIAKKEILYYPFYGQLWYLSGHLIIDRSNRASSVGALKKLAGFMKRKRLSVLLWPEGTRSADGRLRSFKKGFAHLELQTGLPVVPMVTTGAHKAWEKGKLGFKPVPIRIKFLPAIDTSGWTLEGLEQHIEEVRQAFIDALPPEQRPAPAV